MSFIKKEHTPYDEANKRLFSEPQMIKDLIKGFVKDTWIEDLDFSTLDRINASFISSNDELKKRDGDMIWKVRWKNSWVYLIMVIEFQSWVDPIMAIRMSTYTSLLYEEIFKTDKTLLNGKYLPPVLPMVLYNGSGQWTAVRSLRELMDPNLPEGLLKYQPNIHYWLLDESHAKLEDELAGSDNLVSLLVQLQQAKEREEVRRLTDRLVGALKRKSGAESLQRAYTVYLARALKLKKIAPDLKLENITQESQMLSEAVDRWHQEAVEEGFSHGISQGISQGLTLGERTIMERQLNKKFGKLTPAQKQKLNRMSADELLQLSDKILFASSIEEVLGETAGALN